MTTPDPDRTDPLAALADLLAAHQVEHTLDGDWLLLARGCRARAFHHEIGPTVMQLDVRFEPWIGTPVLESCAGFGPTPAAQRADAWRTFAMGSLPVLLATLLYHDDAEVERTAWEIDGLVRAVTLGGLVVRGEPPERDRWRAAVQELIVGSALPEGLHWIRAYVALHEDEVLDTEVLLDSQPWDHGQEALTGFRWPRVDGMASLRLFVVVQGGLDVSRAIADLALAGAREDDGVVGAMAARGVDPLDAAQVIALVPLAFGRLLLEPLGVEPASEGVLVSRATGGERAFAVASHPLVDEASFLAGRGTLTEDQFLAVARRSTEVRAFEAFVEAGHEPSDFRPRPPRVPTA